MPRIAKADVHAALQRAANHIIDAGGSDGRVSRADVQAKTAQLKGTEKELVDIFFRFIDHRDHGAGAQITKADVDKAVAYAKEKMIDKYDLNDNGLSSKEIAEMSRTGKLAVELSQQLKLAASANLDGWGQAFTEAFVREEDGYARIKIPDSDEIATSSLPAGSQAVADLHEMETNGGNMFGVKAYSVELEGREALALVGSGETASDVRLYEPDGDLVTKGFLYHEDWMEWGTPGASDPAPSTDPAQPSTDRGGIYSSMDRLNAMVDLFTDRGNKKLDAGEVQALAGFYGGLKSNSRAKIRDRMVEIYQNADYSAGQQDRFRELLESRGFGRGELEGVDPTTPSGLGDMSDAARSEHLGEIWSDHMDYSPQYSALREVQAGDVTDAAMAKITAAVQEFIDSEQAALDRSGEDDPNVYEGEMRVIHMVDDNGDPDLSTKVAIGVEVHQTFGNGGNTQAMFFDLAGEHIGNELINEE